MVQVVSNGSNVGKPTVTSSEPRAPVWKTVLKVVLIIVAVAAAIYIGAKFVVPAVVKFISGVGATVTAAASAATAVTTAAQDVLSVGEAGANFVSHAARGVKHFINWVDKFGNNSLIVTAAEGISTAIDKVGDMFTVTTSSGTVVNPGAVSKFVNNPFAGVLNIIKGVFK